MPIDPKLIRSVFERSLDLFFQNDVAEVLEGVNERSSCGRMAIYMESVAHEVGLIGYFADTEYNRNRNGKIKTILDHAQTVIAINCDLILHSRGQIVMEGNLIAVEMKKRDRPKKEKVDDCNRLRALTMNSFNDVWSNDGITPPEHVCGYVLGAFINSTANSAAVALSTLRAAISQKKSPAASKIRARPNPLFNRTCLRQAGS